MLNVLGLREKFEEFLVSSLSWRQSHLDIEGLEVLVKSMEYSVLSTGKRFRPLLSLLVADAFDKKAELILPWAAAVELIHSYSLIHDDLPSIDNDDFRRGQPTNHKVYGEASALLAGDALQAEAFWQIANGYKSQPEVAVTLTRMLAEACGSHGMVGGQVLDLSMKKRLDQTGGDANEMPLKDVLEGEILLMHRMKTGALIRTSVEGAAVALGLKESDQERLRYFGEQLGLAFQIKDDLLDSAVNIELGSLPSFIGMERTEKALEKVTHSAMQALEDLNLKTSKLAEILVHNQLRAK